MKRIFLVLFTFLLSTVSAQTTFTKDGLTYQTISESEVKIISCQANVDSISIPQSVLEESTNTNYIVSQIGLMVKIHDIFSQNCSNGQNS